MRTNLNFHISFFVRKRRNNPEASSVYVRISVNSVYRDISLKKTVTASKWDSKANRAKGASNESRMLNGYLDKTSAQIHKHYEKLMEEGVFVSADKIKAPRYRTIASCGLSFLSIISKNNHIPCYRQFANRCNPLLPSNPIKRNEWISNFLLSSWKFLVLLCFQFVGSITNPLIFMGVLTVRLYSRKNPTSDAGKVQMFFNKLYKAMFLYSPRPI